MAKRDLTIIIRGRDRAKKAFRSVGAGMKRMVNVVKKGAIAIAIAGAAAVAATGLAVKSAFSRLDVMAKTIDKLGITSEALAGLGLAAELTGVNIEKLSPSLAKMMKNIAEVARGSGEASKAFDSLGLNAKVLNKLAPDEQFFAIANAMGKVENQSDKVLFAMELFGRQGASLLNTMDLGEEQLRKLQKTAKDFRLAPSRKELAGVEAFNDAWLLVTKMFRGVANTIAIQVAPQLQKLAEFMTDNSKKVFAAIENQIARVAAAWKLATTIFDETKTILSVVAEKIGLKGAWESVMNNYKTVFDFLTLTIENWQLSLEISLHKAELAILQFNQKIARHPKFQEARLGVQVIKEWFGGGATREEMIEQYQQEVKTGIRKSIEATEGTTNLMRDFGSPKATAQIRDALQRLQELEKTLEQRMAEIVGRRKIPTLETVGEGADDKRKGFDWDAFIAGKDEEKAVAKIGGAVASPQMQMSRFLTGVMESTQGKRLDALKKEVKRGSDEQEEATNILSRIEDRMMLQSWRGEAGIFE